MNSLSQLKELSNEELRVLVAEACGWKRYGTRGCRTGDGRLWLCPDFAKWGLLIPSTDELPDFIEDLNAIAEAEKTLSEAEFHRYKVKLALICGDDFWESDKCTHWSADPIVALARQRAIAFLAVRGREGS